MKRFENLTQFGLGCKCMKFVLLCGLMLPAVFGSCALREMPSESTSDVVVSEPAPILPGIYKIDSVANVLKGKKIGVVSNHTGMIGNTHLVDTLLSLALDVHCVFAPEHGFRGDAPNGAIIDNDKDAETGLTIYSLYGKSKKPSDEMLEGLEAIVFDIQDVGVRFYTYIYTLHYVMEAAAEKGIEVIVLDRPNPNGFYIDGPMLEPEHASFIGFHPTPVVYGMTIGEYGQMINGEKWLDKGQSCKLSVVTCTGYTHESLYQLPIKPSPNLPDMESIYLYPSLGFFEGTTVSVGRGTDFPFSIIGEPTNTKGNYTFTPESRPGASVNPPQKGIECRGYNLRETVNMNAPEEGMHIEWLIQMYEETGDSEKFFNANGFINKLTGNTRFRDAVLAGDSADEIRQRWQKGLEDFKIIRAKYLIYE